VRTIEPNPFYERASQRLIERGNLGGKHAASVGDSCGDTKPALQAWFEREREAAAGLVDPPW
jgi:hypothetical protein